MQTKSLLQGLILGLSLLAAGAVGQHLGMARALKNPLVREVAQQVQTLEQKNISPEEMALIRSSFIRAHTFLEEAKKYHQSKQFQLSISYIENAKVELDKVRGTGLNIGLLLAELDLVEKDVWKQVRS